MTPTAVRSGTRAPTLIIDARRPFDSGLGRYLRELAPRLMASGAFGDCVLAGDLTDLRAWASTALPAATLQELAGGRYSLTTQLGWQRIARTLPDGPRVIWFPHLDAPIVRMPSPAVVTVHDLIPLRVPGSTSLLREKLLPFVLRRVTTQATRVLCVSQATADDVGTIVPSVRTRLRVVPNGGAEIAARPVMHTDAIPPSPFLLCVANRKPHKNLALALHVLAALRPQYPALKLVFVGAYFPAWADLQALAVTLRVDDAMIDLGVVNDDQLRALYDRCSALLAPSRHEGFGLPVVEAMACGTPVVAADLPWAHDLGGHAIRYAPIDTADAVSAWCAALTPLLHDSTTRSAAAADGRAQATAFTWERCAAATTTVLLEAAAAPQRA